MNDSIKSFAIKTTIVAGAIVVSLWITLDHIDNLIGSRITMAMNGATKFNPREFWPRFEANIEKAADPSNDLSPERKAKLEAAIRMLRARWKPLLDDAFSDPKPEVAEQHR